MSAQVIRLFDRLPTADVPVVDLVTAVDVVLRDIREMEHDMEAACGLQEVRRRLGECRVLLQQALGEAVAD